jgi:hypothetical protein
MVLMTPERIAARAALTAEFETQARIARGFSEGDPAVARATCETIRGQIQVFDLLAAGDAKLAEVAPFFELYQGLKPDAVRLLSLAVDEVLDVLIQVGNNVTKYQELRELQARSTRATYEAYLAVGFNESQAFACTIRTMEIFDEAMRRSISGINVKSK